MTKSWKKKRRKKLESAAAVDLGANLGSEDVSTDLGDEKEKAHDTGRWSRLVQSRWALLAILLIGYVLRSVALGLKPPHFDEGINGNFVAKLWREGYYHYDPTNFHGPLYFYFLQFAELLFGRTIEGFRYITGLISLGCVALMLLQKRFLGPGAVIAAGFASISVAFVFYSRYAIHESLFIFFQLLFVYGFYLYQDEKSRRAAALMITGVFGAFSVKETFFIFFGTWLIAVACVKIAQRFWPKPWPRARVVDDEEVRAESGHHPKRRAEEGNRASNYWRRRVHPNDLLIFVCYGALATIAVFTGFFLNPSGYHDMFAALMVWAKTGTSGSGQEKPFIYWLELLLRYEWPALVGLALSLPLFFVLGIRQRIMALTCFGTWLAYSIIPYKTPWLILNLLWPMAFVFGFAIEQIRRIPNFKHRVGIALRAASALAAIVLVVRSFQTTLRLNFQDFTNEKEPYVYVQTTGSFKKVLDYIETKLRLRPEARNMRVYALVKDPWPLPWVFSLYPNVFWGQPEGSDLKNPAVLLIDESKRELTEARLAGKFWRISYRLRDSYETGLAYFAFDDFKDVVPSDSPIFEQPEKPEKPEQKP